MIVNVFGHAAVCCALPTNDDCLPGQARPASQSVSQCKESSLLASKPLSSLLRSSVQICVVYRVCLLLSLLLSRAFVCRKLCAHNKNKRNSALPRASSSLNMLCIRNTQLNIKASRVCCVFVCYLCFRFKNRCSVWPAIVT